MMAYAIIYSIFKIFEIVLFLFPAFPTEFSIRILILMIYVISHMFGIQTQYKIFKQSTLDVFSQSDCVLEEPHINSLQ